ncbi:MAG: hypothetical protein ABGX16_05010 [Pirellulales bacterium]
MRIGNLPLSLFIIVLIFSTSVYAQQSRRAISQARKSAAQQPTARSQTGRSIVTPEVANGNEQQVMARVRGYQLVMEREEKVLSQRMAHATKLRQQGLQNKDQKLLDQAEQYERQAITAYQRRIKQFEKTELNLEARGKTPDRAKGSKAYQGKQSTTKSQTRRRNPQAKRKPASRGTPHTAKSVLNWLR